MCVAISEFVLYSASWVYYLGILLVLDKKAVYNRVTIE
jgi:hypothetical protein